MRLQVGQRFIDGGGQVMFQRGKDYRKLTSGSSSNWLSAASAKLCAGRIAAATAATEHFNRLGRAPIERRISDRNAAAPAKFSGRRIRLPAARARDVVRCGSVRKTQRRRVSFDRLKSRVPASAAKFHALRETRIAFSAHYDHERRRISTVLAVETAAA